MGKSWKITRIAGIDVSVHWTFALLLLWVLIATATGAGLGHGLAEVGFVLALFGCVLLHEFGHALAARWFGIPTHDITLLPIGGVARLDRMPRNPFHEATIALAGPAVNVLLIGLLFPTVVALQGASMVVSPLGFGTNFLTRLLWVNVGLVVFNLLPAFPMDGGRVLRATLALRMNYVAATRAAKRLGQFVAFLFLLASFWTSPTLMLVAAFVFFAAESEYQMVRQEFFERSPAPMPFSATDRSAMNVASVGRNRRTPTGAIIGELVSGPSLEMNQVAGPRIRPRNSVTWVSPQVSKASSQSFA